MRPLSPPRDKPVGVVGLLLLLLILLPPPLRPLSPPRDKPVGVVGLLLLLPPPLRPLSPPRDKPVGVVGRLPVAEAGEVGLRGLPLEVVLLGLGWGDRTGPADRAKDTSAPRALASARDTTCVLRPRRSIPGVPEPGAKDGDSGSNLPRDVAATTGDAVPAAGDDVAALVLAALARGLRERERGRTLALVPPPALLNTLVKEVLTRLPAPGPAELLSEPAPLPVPLPRPAEEGVPSSCFRGVSGFFMLLPDMLLPPLPYLPSPKILENEKSAPVPAPVPEPDADPTPTLMVPPLPVLILLNDAVRESSLPL